MSLLLVLKTAGAGGTTIQVPVGAITVTGLAPTLDKGIVPPVGTLTVTGLAPTLSLAIIPPVGAIVVAGLAPVASSGLIISPPVGALVINGLGPMSGVVITTGVGAVTITGLAPSFSSGFLIEPPAGALTLSGLAPLSTAVISIGAGTATITGLAPTSIATVPEFRNNGPGLTLLFGLNLSESNFTFSPANAEMQAAGVAPSLAASYAFAVPVGAITTLGYAPSASSTLGNQAPVMDAPRALTITGLSPTVIHGQVVRFPFTTTAEGFVANPDVPTMTMAWIASGNPGGSINKRVNGNNVTSVGFWRLTADWATLGVPAGRTVTAISLAQVDQRVTEYSNGAPGNYSAVTLIPTAFPPIELSAARPFSAAEAGWTTVAGAGASGLQIPSGGSLTITCGSIVNTGPTGTVAVNLLWDNLAFLVSYTAALTVVPDAGTVTATGYAPTVIAAAAQFAAPGAGSLSIEGLGPSVSVTAPFSYGGGGPGMSLLFGMALEQTALGPANLVITGYAPVISRPITLGGSDDLLSERATLVGSGNIVIVGGSTIETPGTKALAITGLAPTLVETGARIVSIPTGTLTFTYYVPTLGVDHVRAMAVGELFINGFGPSVAPDYTVSPLTGSASFAGLAPISLVSLIDETGVGAITITGYAPAIGLDVTFAPAAGALTIVGEVAEVIGAMSWNGSGVLESQRASLTSSTTVIRKGSGDLQSQQPLAFVGSATHVHVATGAMQSGPASFHGPISGVTAELESGRATMKSRASIIRFKPHKRPKPQRVNRYTVQLKPNKRNRIRKPNRRKPWK